MGLIPLKLVVLPWIFIAIVAVLGFWLKIQLPKWIGNSGERFVSRKLRASLDPQKYEVLDDILLPSGGRTETTQIDHLIVSNFGIFVIETKNYEGWIFGNAYDKQWTQVIYRHKERFFNPVHQNFAHIEAVKKVLSSTFPALPVYGYVIFPTADKLKITGADTVGYTRDVIAKIKDYTIERITDTERVNVTNLLKTSNIVDEAARERHLSEVRNIKSGLMSR